MSEGYEREKRLIDSSKNWAALNGFRDAKNGNYLMSNYFFGYTANAYTHGRQCYKASIIPWALQLEYLRINGDNHKEDLDKLRQQFEKTGKLPQELETCL